MTDSDDAQATFVIAKNGKPQCIGHRGYRAAFPENTMASFRGAVDIGAHAIETDVHLSKDGVVVLSHVRDGAERWIPLVLIHI
jgi:phosphatidylglycerol phospholipase C